MSNALTGNPLYVDSTTGAAVTGMQKIQKILWVPSTGTDLDIAADEDFRVDDAAGNYIIGKRAEAAGDGLEVSFLPHLQVNGITVAVMGGGVCYVYLA